MFMGCFSRRGNQFVAAGASAAERPLVKGSTREIKRDNLIKWEFVYAFRFVCNLLIWHYMQRGKICAITLWVIAQPNGLSWHFQKYYLSKRMSSIQLLLNLA